MKSVADKNYWDNHWKDKKFAISPSHHPIRQWIEKEAPRRRDDEVFEIGCYPGKFLSVFGKKGYVLSGVDTFPETNSTMVDWMKSEGYKIGTFNQMDFWDLSIDKRYDIVCSFGFIEHFKNWKEALEKHVDLTKDKGTIMVDVPNLNSPLYYFLYKILEPEVLRNHETSAMDKKAIVKVFKDRGCSIKTEDYGGSFYFRFVTRHSRFSKFVAKFINSFSPLLELLPRSIYARYIIVSACKE